MLRIDSRLRKTALWLVSAHFFISTVIFAFPAGSLAQGAGELEQAQNAYYDGDFDRTINLLIGTVTSPRLTDAQVDTAYQFLGSAYFLKGQAAQAQNIFRDFVTFNPRAALDESFFPPEVVSAFAAVKAQYLASLGTAGFLRLAGQPKEAELKIDGKRQSLAAEPLKVLPGRRTIEVLQNGQVIYTGLVDIRTGETITVDTSLKRIMPGLLALQVVPPDALIFIDGVAVSLVNGRAELPAGGHTLKATKIGYQPYDGKFTLSSGEQTSLTINLEPASQPATPALALNATPKPSKPLFKKPIFWGILGAAVIGGVVVAAGGGGGRGTDGGTTALPPPPPPPGKR